MSERDQPETATLISKRNIALASSGGFEEADILSNRHHETAKSFFLITL